MSAREEILARIRAAVASGAPPHGGGVDGEAPRGYRAAGEHPPGSPELVELLVERLVDYRATVHRAPAGDIAAAVATAVAQADVGADGRRAPLFVVPADLPTDWLPPSVEAATDDGLSLDRLDAVDGVLTGAAVAIAETGTIVLDGGAGQGRRMITLLPDLHVCVLRTDQVVGTVPEAVALLDPRRPLTWISGPSATSDIELNRVEGVHGPRRLHVIVTAP